MQALYTIHMFRSRSERSNDFNTSFLDIITSNMYHRSAS